MNEDQKIKVDLAQILMNEIENSGFEYIYRGKFNRNITLKILSLTEDSLQKNHETRRFTKRIYFIMTECLQNISKHQVTPDIENVDKHGVFFIQKKNESVFIYSGNLIDHKTKEALEEKINSINSLNPDEIKKLYSQRVMHGELSEKGGAGLGLIAIAKKTRKKIFYDFRKITDGYFYFYLKTEVPLKKNNN